MTTPVTATFTDPAAKTRSPDVATDQPAPSQPIDPTSGETTPREPKPGEPVVLVPSADLPVRPWLTPLRAGLLLLLITLVGAGLRLSRLDQPAIWGDESATFGRVCGTYQDLLDTNAADGFTPLHYELVWWIRNGMPYWGKFEPKTESIASSGVRPDNNRSPTNRTNAARTIPADQIDHVAFTPDPDRKISRWFGKDQFELTPKVLRAVPAICGILLVPAMYWLTRQFFGRGVSLITALLCATSAYLLVYSRDAKMYSDLWLMVVLHVTCFFWWMRSRRFLPWLCWTLTGVIMLGLQMVSGFIVAVELVIFLTLPRQHWRGHLTLLGLVGWVLALPFLGLWTLRFEDRKARAVGWMIHYPLRVWRRFRLPPIYGVAATLIIFYFALWGPLGYLSAFSRFDDNVVKENLEINAGNAKIGWVQGYNRGRTLDDLLLFTTSAYFTGWEWPANHPREHAEEMVDPRMLRLMKSSTVLILCLLSLGILPWQKIFAPHRARVAMALERTQVPRSVIRRRVFWLAIWLTLPTWIIYNASMENAAAPLDLVTTLATTQPASASTSSWWSRSSSPTWPRLELPRTRDSTETPEQKAKRMERYWSKTVPEFKIAWTRRFETWKKQVAWEKLDHRVVYGAIGLAVLLIALVLWRRQVMLISSLRLLLTIIAVALILSLLSVLVPASEGSVWMPRYLGVVLPSVFIIAAVLIARQPSRVLGALTIAVFVAVNMMQFGNRVYGYSEPPIDRVVTDVLLAQPKDTHTRTYTDLGDFGSAEPGQGMLPQGPGRYYLRVQSGIDAPQQVMFQPFGGNQYLGNFKFWNFDGALRVADDVQNNPQLDHIIVWTGLPAGSHDDTDHLKEQLGDTWKRLSDEWIPIRDHWMWLDYYTLRRREYVKVK